MKPSSLSQQPRNLTETGIEEELVKDLLLKHLFDGVMLDLQQLRNRLKLAGNLLEPILDKLRQNQRLQIHGPKEGETGIRFQLTELGLADASNALLRSGYLGPAPISLEHYNKLIAAQSVLSDTLTREQIQAEFKDVVIDPHHLDVIGPALYSGRPVLVYGQAGTGKTYICKKMAALLGGSIWLPYAIAVGREIIQYYDPLIHIPIQEAPSHTDQTIEYTAVTDQRLLLCQRPVAVSGGELTMEQLEICHDLSTRMSSAPIQMKANNGIYIIDDMGRQCMPPIELFNRWIVPMEERRDYLALQNGKQISVPFDCVLVFSTNLHPTELADDAFLRRLGYKIHFTPISQTHFREIWDSLVDDKKITIELGVLDDLFNRFQDSGRDLLPCHPRDLMGIALDLGAYQGISTKVTKRNIALAWDTYFVSL